ncbi:hypothetical protein [Streptomyces bohaiensis]|uniref:NsdA n=1 Tax=Streptomyces bohaiensis TaxID=1431344 RepID=A0ABX1C800_9ACTN|nr:hypothetical protein [Streptomyces bohaiensis]NJQ15284.1 hypothetical protein [Streptomyces bohaiensis]
MSRREIDGDAAKRPNDRLTSWFQRSGWSKGEMARQVNRRARHLGAHHVSTDTSRVRRWLDGEQPREPIPRILSDLFSERFSCVVTVEDLGLRSAPHTAAATGIDLPWAGPQTVQSINEFTRGDLMLGRRGFLGTSLSMSAGPALIEPMQRWLVPTQPGAEHASAQVGLAAGTVGPSAGRRGGAGISRPELELLESSTSMFRLWDAACGGGLRRKAVVGQLHEITDLLQEYQPESVRRRLFRVTAELAELAGWMSYDIGLQPTAQKYFVLALHAAKEAEDRPLGAYVLSRMTRQMIHLGRGEDALELVHLAQYGSRDSATPRVQALLHALEARAYAAVGAPAKVRRAVRIAEETFEEVSPHDGDPDWASFFTEAQLSAESAHAYRDLAYNPARCGMYTALAKPPMRRAVELFGAECGEPGSGHQRSYALNLIGLATVHLLDREPEEGAARAHDAADVAENLRSERVTTRLHTTAATMVRDFGGVPAVRDLAERLRFGRPGDHEEPRAG